jgi:uncharacterized 2Fe-2S/4Fe-4S cluster protein (DUF4445 family)
MSADGPLVIFTPSGRRGRVAAGTTLLDAARLLGVDIDSVCGGRATCGRCQVAPAFGAFTKHGITSAPDHVGPEAADEATYRAEHGLPADRRLACLARVGGDLLVDVPPESQVHRQVVRKELKVRPFELDPVLRLREVRVPDAELATPRGDLARLRDALAREWGLTDLDADLDLVRALQPALRAQAGLVTVAIRDDRRIAAVWPGFHERALGVAIDVGSTTIAGHLADLSTGEVLASGGAMNPQIRFGEDLMSRVSYAMLHPEGAAEMTREVRAALEKLIAGLANAAGVKRAQILELVVVGNPIMHHLLLGLDPIPLGSAPFALATDGPVETSGVALGLRVHPAARVHALPCIAGHVGADTAGVILAEQPDRIPPERTCLIVDVGTNAEIVLAAGGRLLAASSPTGPAFEGAQISSGQRAAPGAIERVRIDRETLEPRFRVIGVEPWSDAPDFDDALLAAGVGISGICGSGIVEAIAELFLAGLITADGVIDGRRSDRTDRIVPDGRTYGYRLHHDVLVTQNDVRAIQLAKAALYAGARLLMDEAGVETLDEVRLAGAFGSQIDPLHALILGLVPDCAPAEVRAAGNAAGAGALIALLSGAERRSIAELVRRVTKVETAVEPRFQEHFVEAMAIPHRTAPSTRLGRVVQLPARPANHDSGAPGLSGARTRRRTGRPRGFAGPEQAGSAPARPVEDR